MAWHTKVTTFGVRALIMMGMAVRRHRHSHIQYTGLILYQVWKAYRLRAGTEIRYSNSCFSDTPWIRL